MVRDSASTPTVSRAHPQWPDDEGSPGASSSSSPSNVILPKRQCPGVEHDIRSELLAAIEADEPEASNFIDDIVMSEAMWREQQEPGHTVPCRKRLRDKTNPEALCGSSPQAGLLLLPTDDIDTDGMPEWKATKTARCKYAALATRTRNKGTETYREIFDQACTTWSDKR